MLLVRNNATIGVIGENGMMWVDFSNRFLQFLHPALQQLILSCGPSQDGLEVVVCFIEVVIGEAESLYVRVILLNHHTLHGLQVIQEGHLRTPPLLHLQTTPLIRLITHRKHRPDALQHSRRVIISINRDCGVICLGSKGIGVGRGSCKF